jgi:hypothetical protein
MDDGLLVLLKDYTPGIAIAIYLLVRLLPRVIKLIDLYIEYYDHRNKNRY